MPKPSRSMNERCTSENRRWGLIISIWRCTLNGLADLYREQGKYEQAEPLYQRALGIIQKQSQESDHPNMAFPLNGLADLYREQKRFLRPSHFMNERCAFENKNFSLIMP